MRNRICWKTILLYLSFRYLFYCNPKLRGICWRKRCPNINFTINYIIFLKNRNIDSRIWNFIFVCAKCKVYPWHRIICNSWFINYLCISCRRCDRVNFLTWSVISFFHQLEQRALKAPMTMEHIENSSFYTIKK